MKRTPLRRSGPLTAKTPIRQVSPKKAKHRASQAGQAGAEHMLKVKALPCCVCGAPPPSDAHHVIHDRFGSRKSSDFDTIPLCEAHHQDGPLAIHNGKQRWREAYGPDHKYLDWTKKMLDKR